MMSVGTIFIENLVEILLGLVVAFNLAAFSMLWSKIQDIGEKADKNTETMNMLLNRIFGIEQDPTDKGHIMETEKRFDGVVDKLEEIAEKQEEDRKERRKEHEKVDDKISSIINVLKDEDNIEVDNSDFN